MGISKMAGFCLNYMKILCLTGFLLLACFALMINCEVETMKVNKENRKSGTWITLITSGLYLIGFIFFAIKINKEDNEEFKESGYREVMLQENLISMNN